MWQQAMQIGGILLMVVFGLIVVGIAGVGAWLYGKRKQYEHYKVFIWKRYKDNKGNEIPMFVRWDKGAIKKDKKLNKWVFNLKKWNIDLGEAEQTNEAGVSELNIPTIPSESGGEIVFIEKLAPRKGAIGKPYVLEGQVKVIVSEADVAEAMRSFDINARTFGTKDNKFMAFALYMILAVLVLVMIIVILNKFEGITLASQNLVTASQNFLAASSNAVPSTAPG